VVAEDYTAVIGAQLGILPKTPESLRPEDLKLNLKVKPLSEAQVEVRFVRGRTDGVNLYFRRAGGEELYDLGRFFHSPAIVKIPTLDDKPEQIYLSGRYLIGNNAVGSYSGAAESVVTP
jgi:hypothetical protein